MNIQRRTSMVPLVLLIVTGFLSIIYKMNEVYEYGYWAAAISLILFSIGGLLSCKL